ncbi:MAG TPA: hypothetical protein VJA94_06365 [Candidatus Angelobacter sp.]
MPIMNRPAIAQPVGRTFIAAVTGAWCAYLVLDFLANAVFLAPYWRATESYWLPPQELLRMIPLGYAGFAIYCTAATWLLIRLYGSGPTVMTGLRFGAVAGFFFGTIATLGSYSVFRMPVSALMVWPVSAVVESAGAGAAAAWILAAEHPWRRAGLVFGSAVLLFVLSVLTQNLIVSKIR